MSMSAKELHEELMDEPHDERDTEKVQLILRALSLLAAVEDGDEIVRELEECERIVGNLCADGRCPKMSIPVRDDDEDMRLTRTMKQARARITQDARDKAAKDEQLRMTAQAERIQIERAQRAEAELASAKAQYRELCEATDVYRDAIEDRDRPPKDAP